MSVPPLDAFTGYGIEIEYMIVDRNDLSVRPVADKLLRDAVGRDACEVDRGLLGWSNELVRHVVEVKNPRPVASMDRLPEAFQAEVQAINALLAAHDARLMPGAMHPWMDPRADTALWPQDPQGIYDMYGRIFDTGTHGWANLQSMHVNLPFADDAQFARLHAAVRLVLPVIPALAASSPVADGVATGCADFRMDVYRHNADAFPSIAGKIVPETVSSRAEYEQRILAPMYRDIAAQDRDRILQHEWLNSRGAIARFDRNAIEIRVIDTQECPQADLAVAVAVIAVVRMLYGGRTSTLTAQQAFDTDRLAGLLHACIEQGERAVLDDRDYLAALGYPGARCEAGQLWRHLLQSMPDEDTPPTPQAPPWRAALDVMIEHGPLARRIERAIDGDYSRDRLQAVYRRLCDCLDQGIMFTALPHGG